MRPTYNLINILYNTYLKCQYTLLFKKGKRMYPKLQNKRNNNLLDDMQKTSLCSAYLVQ